MASVLINFKYKDIGEEAQSPWTTHATLSLFKLMDISFPGVPRQKDRLVFGISKPIPRLPYIPG
jgi:hypothetical protein